MQKEKYYKFSTWLHDIGSPKHLWNLVLEMFLFFILPLITEIGQGRKILVSFANSISNNTIREVSQMVM